MENLEDFLRDAGRQAASEQQLEASKGFALYMATYFRELTRHGFSREEALSLTMAYQSIILNNAMNGGAT